MPLIARKEPARAVERIKMWSKNLRAKRPQISATPIVQHQKPTLLCMKYMNELYIKSARQYPPQAATMKAPSLTTFTKRQPMMSPRRIELDRTTQPTHDLVFSLRKVE